MFAIHEDAEENAKELGVDMEKFKEGLDKIQKTILEMTGVTYEQLGEGQYKISGPPKSKYAIKNVVANIVLNTTRIVANGDDAFSVLMAFAVQKQINEEMMAMYINSEKDSLDS